VRTAVVGGAAVCIGLLAEWNLPDANALSILLPAGNGNATQVNILEGNVFRPQFGLSGDGNVSNNRSIGSIIFGGSDPTGRSHVLGPIALGGAKGDGNVTQINVLSYNIINPQGSLFGSNTSVNTTVSNVSVGNGNSQSTSKADTAGEGGLIGPALSSGNTRQLSILSSNIFNPQFSLFGANTSDNTAVTNVSAVNGNGSPTASGGIFGGAFNAITGSGNTGQAAAASANIFNPQYSLLGGNTSRNLALTNQSFSNGNFSPTYTEGGGLGAFLVGITGSGNSNQMAGLVSNIFNSQGTFGGVNLSVNEAGSNNAGWNGRWSPNDVTSTGGGNNTVFGRLGSGTANQIGNGNGNIVNNQFRLFTALTNPQQQPVPTQVQQIEQTPESQAERLAKFTNEQIGDDDEQGRTSAGTGTGELIDSTGQPAASAGPRKLSPLGQRIAEAVKNASDNVKGALGLNKPKGTGGSPGATNNEPTGG
jgi:hypothetical protein